MRRIAIVLGSLLALLPPGPAAAQQAAPSFKGGVSLVTIDVTVIDRDGRPISGLIAEDFQVKLNGKVQPIRALTFLEARRDGEADASSANAPVMPQMFPVADVAGTTSSRQAESRVFVVLVDDVSFAATGGKALFAAARRFVAALPASALVGFATSSGAGAVNPTPDRAPIDAALKAVAGEYLDPRAIDRGGPAGPNSGPDQPLGISQSLDIDRGDDTAFLQAVTSECFHGDNALVPKMAVAALLAANKCASDLHVQARRTAALTRQTTGRQIAAFQSVIQAMKPAAGIKHLVLLTEGIGVTFDASTLQPLARAAAEAGVQLSVLVEEPGLSLGDAGRRAEGEGARPSADTGMSQRRREDNAMFVTGAQTMAGMVGGAFYRIVGSPDPFFARVALASSAIYRLAVEPPPDTTPGREFALVATVRKSGVTVLANKRALAAVPAPPVSTPAPGPAAKPAMTVDDRLRVAMTTGRTFDGVAIDLATGVRRAETDGQVELGIRVRIAPGAAAPLTAVFGIVDAAGRIKSGRRTIETRAADDDVLTFSVPVAPGAYRLRFAVADGSEHVGAVEKAVSAELGTIGPFSAGDLQAAWLDAEEKAHPVFPAGGELATPAKTLAAFLDLHPLAGLTVPGDLLIRMSFSAEGQQGIERMVTPVNDNGVWRAEAQFPLERIAPGTYAVVATVVIDGKVAGTRTASFTKR